MIHTKISFLNCDEQKQEQIMALLQHADCLTGFEQLEALLVAYFAGEEYDSAAINKIAKDFSVSLKSEIIEDKNWNEVWENNFEPVLIDDFCYIRADFHPAKDNIKHQINITPKMSFGTGHHATTQMMIQLMRDIDFNDKKVFDFGTGTGVLAILAEQLGAKNVEAVDNDIWGYENALENCARNKTYKTTVRHGSIELYNNDCFEIILANINRHILEENMATMAQLLNPDGILILSGILAVEDEPIILRSAGDNHLHLIKNISKDKWAALAFRKG